MDNNRDDGLQGILAREGTVFSNAARRPYAIVDVLLVVGLFAILPLEHTPALRLLFSVVLGLRGLWLLAVNPDRTFLLRAWALGPWVAWASASYLWSMAPETTLANLKHDLWTPLLALFGCYQVFRHGCPRATLLLAVAAGTLSNSIVTVFGAPSAFYLLPWASHYFSTVGYSSTYALYFSALALPWALGSTRLFLRYLALVVLLANLGAAIVTENRMFFLAALVLLAFYGIAIRAGRRAAYAIAAVAVVLIAMFTTINQERMGASARGDGLVAGLTYGVQHDNRFMIWERWANRAIDGPAAGVGFGRDVSPVTLALADRNDLLAVDPFGAMHSHNIFLNVIVELGWPGLACFVLLLGQIFWQFLRARLADGQAALSGLLLIAAMVLKNQTDVFMLFGPAVLFYGALGSLLAWLRVEPSSS